MHPLLLLSWLGRGRGRVYDIIDSSRGGGSVSVGCASRAECAVLNGGKEVRGGRVVGWVSECLVTV